MRKRQILTLVVFALTLALGAVSVSAESKTLTISVEGMHCGKCASSVEKKLKATKGVEEVRVSFEKKEAWVRYDDQKVSEAQLREVINSTGFKAVEGKPAASTMTRCDCCGGETAGRGCCAG